MGFINKLDKQYTDLVQDILDNGVVKQDRTGTGTLSVFGRQIHHDMKDGFPLLTTKKMPFKTIVTELLWFLRGDTNIKYLVDNNCHIWDGDAYKRYSITMGMTGQVESLSQEEFINKIKTDDKFAERWGELGPIYGKQWRSWENIQTQDYTMSSGLNSVRNVKTQIDQIANLISDLKTNPDSRRLMVNAWNVGELDQMVLPPCHYGFQVYTRELSLRERKDHAIDILRYESLLDYGHSKNEDDIFIELMDKWNVPTRAISLMWNQRSVDTGLGLPFNIASYGLLLTMLAEEVNMVPDQLIGNLGDVHLYSNHVEPIKEQFGRKLKFPERTEMLKDKMGEEKYNKAVDELMPFGGGMSEYFETYEIPYTTREPLPLPKVTINPNNKMRIGGGIFTYDVGDFTLEDYVSHPTIKLPLSN
jgi:thymidylate synthase